MRIAMVGPFGFHPKKTMRSRALPLAKALSAQGHQVKILMPPWHTPELADRDWQEDGVDIRYVALGGGVLGRSWRLMRETLAWQPEVVHTFKPKAYSGLVAWWLWQFHRRGLKIVTDSDDWVGWGGWNDMSPYSGTQKKFFSWQEKWGLKHCHAITVASRSLQSIAWTRHSPAGKVHYLPNGPGISQGISPETGPGSNRREELGLSERPVVLIYSRWFEFDNQRLISVLKLVHQAVPDMAILLVGATLLDEDAAEFRRQMSDSDLEDAIVDLGWVEEQDLPATLSSADVGLYLMDDTLLNRSKCPVKLADMLAMGVPVVGESVGQVPEYIIHDRTGLLVGNGDKEGIAAGLITLLQDKDDRHRLGQAAQTHIRNHFNWFKLATDLAQVYISINVDTKHSNRKNVETGP